MKTYTFKISKKDIRNIRQFDKKLSDLLTKINPRKEEYAVAFDYSDIDYPPLATVTAIAISKLIKAGFKKVIITGTKYSDGIKKHPACDYYMSRGQLEIG